MYKIMLIYPPGKLYQRGEARSQGNIEDSSATSMRACNDLGYGAAVLLKKGYDVFLRDYQTEKASEADLLSDVKRYKPNLLMLSVTNATIYEDIAIADKIAESHRCKIALEGAIFYDPEKEMLDLLDLSNIDFLIGGEVDFIIHKIADAVFKQDGQLKSIDNILYKNSEGQFISTRFHVWNEDLDAQPFPARQLMNNQLYVRPDTGRPMATIQTSRGCPANCIYCLSPEISGQKVRFRSPLNVYEEMCECFYKYHIKDFFFKADTFTINPQWVKELCHLIIDSPLYKKIHFTANSRVRPLDEDTLLLMKKAGCFAVAFGFESGNETTLKQIKKGTCVADNLQAARWCKKAKLQTYGFFMIGFPWETRQDIQDTIDHLFRLDTDFIEIHIALPYYGTSLYNLCMEEGTLTSSTLGSDYFHSSTIGSKYVTMDELNQIRKKTIRKYYLRPMYLIRKLSFALLHPVILKNYIRYGLRVIGM